ncbi:Fructose dehydrogenase cytochrome subunit precursor [compost metagenome]
MKRYMGGGFEFKADGHGIWMPNITQDKQTGIGNWSDPQIEAAIRYGQRPDGPHLSPVMPWSGYNGMSQDDMRALIAYMRTVPPVKSEAPKSTVIH